MNYRNSEMKIDQLVGYLNDEKINLSPAFQRGRVWSIKQRKKLLRNMIQGKPIPAVFLYKEASGAKYSYNILDGKQRLESLILFIGNRRNDLKIEKLEKYFFSETEKRNINYQIELEEGKRRFREINEDVVRDFREYAIPTIEIRLDDETSLDEIISLFVDINQQGVSVNRFDIVKAMCQGVPILKNVFGLLALHQRRGQDVHYKMKDNEFTVVLKNLQIIDRIAAGNAKVDRMWEKLLELALFLRSSKHRKPVEILKGFISQDISKTTKRLTKTEERELRVVFRFLRKAIKTTKLRNTKLFVDQTHFYTMVTSIIRANLLKFYTGRQLERRLEKFGRILDGKRTVGNRSTKIQLQKYQDLSAKQTTDVSRRFDRDKLFVSIINTIDS